MTRALIISLYDLGHQPYELLQLDAALTQAEITSSIIDLSITAMSELKNFDLKETYVIISVPMHTAARLALSVLEALNQWDNRPQITLMGHYAEAMSTLPLPIEVTMFASGEAIDPIVDNICSRIKSRGDVDGQASAIHVNTTTSSRRLKLIDFPLHREKLPSLDQYTSYIDNEKMKVAGYVEASRGCLHHCTHCPRCKR